MHDAIRRATPNDAEGIAQVQVESWNTTYKGIVPDAFLASLHVAEQADKHRAHLADDSKPAFVAEQHGQIIGFIAGGAIREPLDGYDGELYAIYLLAHHQGKGTGKELCRQLATQLRHRGLQSMIVWVLEQNPAVSFYKRLGGVQVKSTFITLGGVELPELAFGWPTLEALL